MITKTLTIMTSPHKQLITIPLQTLVDLTLRDSHDTEVPREVADLIFLLTKNEHTCYIQYTDRDNEPLEHPRLWNLHQWRISTESWIRSKDASRKRKVDGWIFDANVTKIQKAIERMFSGMSNGPSRALAYQLLKRGDLEKINMFKVGKLIEKEEEL